MKKIAKVLGITFCLALAFLFLQKPLKAEAATTFKATWSTTLTKWVYSNDGGVYWTEGKDCVEDGMKDGDVLVIDGAGASTGMLTLNINARVGELAVCGGAFASVTAKGVDTAYAVNDGSTLVVTSDVKKLIANYGGTAQVVGNVSEVQAVYKEGIKIGLGITGTVGKANVYFAPDSWTQKTVYNVAAGKFEINDNNFFVTDAKYYSLTPTAGSNGKKELDKVPKTGGRFEVSVLFFLIAAGLVVAGISLNKKRNVNL